MSTLPENIRTAYLACEKHAKQHYENFPVASVLLPKQLRQPISAIYAFARFADDLADEGNAEAAERLQSLEDYTRSFHDAVTNGYSPDPVMLALNDTIQRYHLSTHLFTDLIDAFKQDVTTTRYRDFTQLCDYCRRSANPVGRLLLQLVNKDHALARQQSDAICTALQLLNFYQDISQDFEENNRIYLPQDEMQQAGVTEQHIATRNSDKNFRDFMHQQVIRADNMLLSGYPLCRYIGGRLGLELRITVHAAHTIARKLLLTNNCFSRPRLSKMNWPGIIVKSIVNQTPSTLDNLV